MIRTEQATNAPATNTRRLAGLWVLAVIVVGLVIYNALRVESGWLFNPDIVQLSRDLPKTDRVDIPLILGSLSTKPTFASTFAWWHTSWIKEVPYWRPLSIQTFWLEKHAFGVDRFDKWMWVTFTAHLAFVAAFGWFALLLTRRPTTAWLAVAFLAACRPAAIGTNTILVDITHVPSNYCIDAWKNQPDLFADLFLFLCLGLALKQRYFAAIACAFIATAFKESGWMVWPMAAVLLLATGRARTVPSTVYGVATAAIALLLGLRALSGWDVFFGYHVGSNHFWASRYARTIGPYVTLLLTSPYTWIAGNTIAAAAWLHRRRPLALAVLASGLTASLVVQCRTLGESLVVAIASYTDPILGVDFLTCIAAVVFSLWSFTRTMSTPDTRPSAIVALVGVVITAAPTVAAGQVLEHALHQCFAFESLWWALAVNCALVSGVRGITEKYRFAKST